MNGENGYATVAVTALLAALSTISLAMLNYSISQSELTTNMSATIVIDVELENIFNEIAADIVNGRTEVRPNSATLSKKKGAVEVLVQITDDAKKIGLSKTTKENAHLHMKSSDISELKSLHTSALRDIKSQQYSSLTEFFTESELPCAVRHFTVFHPSSSSHSSQKKKTTPDGSILTLHLSTIPPAKPRALVATILLTGKSSEPIWIMDWIRFSPKTNEAC